VIRRYLWLAVVVACAHPAAAQAQAPVARSKRMALSIGTTLSGGYHVGDVTADLRRNAPGPPQAVPLLRAESTIESTAGLDARVSIDVAQWLTVEVRGAYETPRLGVTISQDMEAGGGGEAFEDLSQYGVDFSGIYHLSSMTLGTRARPYAIGGAGYLRQVHEGRLQIDEGSTIHGGAGLLLWLRGGPTRQQRPFGARAEVRIVHRIGGIDFEDKGRTFPTFSALAFVGF
jgi:opacity protein-like surface antigen